ncbi:Y-family DNA polymerase [Mycoplasma putrefaciens]|uniref:DNA polymerase IV n=1 Tax=Mycoplasma putrefaciens (strain ATCC 15718 / NCTC 10155 / C30 KS-1 / KS-1) TaxID=743965 RepID=A0A7U4E9D5_MYCPK|nr:DNA polymerase IV [Mycoplasma putrefaciens]AEM68794.1 DNA polymerase IV [Mycoplasma putrefaciens KS1]
MSQKTIFHIDMDAFFASCMQVLRPELKNKPIVISNGLDKSIITAASYQARKYHIKAGMAIFEAKKLCPKIISIKPNMNYISYLSNQIWDYLKTNITDKIEIASIDEAYLDVTDLVLKIDAVKLARKIQTEILQKFNLTCSIGISFNKFVAKMSTGLNKPFGVSLITKNNFEIIQNLDIKKMYGIGSSTVKLLEKTNIKTIKDLANTSDEDIYYLLNKKGLTLKNAAKGLSSDYVDYLTDQYKSISKEITLLNPSYSYDEIEELILVLSKQVSNKLINNNLSAKTIEIKLRYKSPNYYDYQNKNQQTKHKQITLNNYVNDQNVIFSSALTCFYEIYDETKPVTLVGIGVSKLINNKQNWIQLSTDKDQIIDNQQVEQSLVIEDLIFDINKKFSKSIIKKAKDLKKTSR